MSDTQRSARQGDASAAPEFPWFQRRNQLLWAACITALLLVIVGDFAWSHLMRPSPIDIDHAPPVSYQYQLDVNSAEWPEFTLLPGISETYARRIVEYREAHGGFQSIDGLKNVSGIGEKRLDAMRPYLAIGDRTVDQ